MKKPFYVNLNLTLSFDMDESNEELTKWQYAYNLDEMMVRDIMVKISNLKDETIRLVAEDWNVELLGFGE